MIYSIQSKNSPSLEENKNYNASLQDLQALQKTCSQQKKLCINEEGHFWVQDRKVNILTQICQWISRLLFEKSFDSPEERQKFLVDRVECVLKFVEESGRAADLKDDILKKQLDNIHKFNRQEVANLQNFFVFEWAETILKAARVSLGTLPPLPKPLMDMKEAPSILVTLKVADIPAATANIKEAPVIFSTIQADDVSVEMTNRAKLPSLYAAAKAIEKIYPTIIEEAPVVIQEEDAYFKETSMSQGAIRGIVNSYRINKQENSESDTSYVDLLKKEKLDIEDNLVKHPNDKQRNKQALQLLNTMDQEIEGLRELERAGLLPPIENEILDLQSDVKMTIRIILLSA